MACACGQPIRVDQKARGKHGSEVGRRNDRTDGGGTYVFCAEGEGVLHRLLCILIDRLALRLLCKTQKEVEKYQCLDQDMPLESEIAQLGTISHSASTKFALIAYLELE